MIGSKLPAELPQFSLEKLAVRFTPSFHGHEISLRPLPRPSDPVSLPKLTQKGDVKLPELPEPPKIRESSPTFDGKPRIRVGKSLEARQLTVDEEMLSEALAEPSHGQIRAQLHIDSRGKITHFLILREPESGIAYSQTAKIRNSLRFSVANSSVQDWIEILW